MTYNQHKIIQFALSNNREITKKQAVDLIGWKYYHNKEKHTGEVLSKMVKSNILIRIKPGYFKLGTGTKHNPATIIDNQPMIF